MISKRCVHAHTNLHLLETTLAGGGNDADKMMLLATAPLTMAPWKAMKSVEILVFRNGENILVNSTVTSFLHTRTREAGLGTHLSEWGVP